MYHGVSIKIEGWGLAMNEILRGPTPTVSPFMANLQRYAALYV